MILEQLGLVDIGRDSNELTHNNNNTSLTTQSTLVDSRINHTRQPPVTMHTPGPQNPGTSIHVNTPSIGKHPDDNGDTPIDHPSSNQSLNASLVNNDSFLSSEDVLKSFFSLDYDITDFDSFS